MQTQHSSYIYLVGYMAVGKTTVGRKLAQKLQLPFYDLDHIIEGNTGQTIAQIFESQGQDEFRKIESNTLKKTLTLPPSIISCGGGTPCFFNNMDWMNSVGTTIWLQLPLPMLVSRLIDHKATRPLIAQLTDEEITTHVQSQMELRTPFYRMAKLEFDVRKSIATLVNLLPSLA